MDLADKLREIVGKLEAANDEKVQGINHSHLDEIEELKALAVRAGVWQTLKLMDEDGYLFPKYSPVTWADDIIKRSKDDLRDVHRQVITDLAEAWWRGEDL